MSSSKITKREFLKKISVTFGFMAAQQSLAASIVESMAMPDPNQFQSDLIKNPKKQQLIAEVAECLFIPVGTPAKTKCLSGDA